MSDCNERRKQRAMAVLTDFLAQKRHRRTPERMAVLDTVCGMDGLFTLDELEASMVNDRHFRVSRPTLYSAIRLFMELRLVVRHRFQGATKYEVCLDGESHCHQVCTVCGKMAEVKAPEVRGAVEQMHLSRFRMDGFALYVYGVCSTCQARIRRRKSMEEKPKAQKAKDRK